MKTAGRQAHCRCGIGEQLPARIVRRCDAIEQLSVSFGIRARTMAIVAVGLELARDRDAFRHLRTAFGRWLASSLWRLLATSLRRRFRGRFRRGLRARFRRDC